MMPPSAGDAESERLRIELARAMNARRDSEQRIQLLKEQMTLHNARAQQDQHRAAAAQAADHYLASLLGPGSASGPPHSPSRARMPVEPPRDPSELREVERALLKEALARRLIPPGAPLDSLYHRGQPPPPVAASHSTDSIPSSRSSSAPLKKRQRFGFDRPEEDGDAKMSSDEKSEGSACGVSRPRSSSYDVAGVARAAAAENRPTSASADEIGFYKDLYANLLGPRGQHPPRPAREEALLDGLARPFGGGARPNEMERALLEGLARRGGGHPHSPRVAPRYPPPPGHHQTPHYPPPSPGGMRGPEYAALLARLAAGRARDSAASYPARDEGASPSRQDLIEMAHAASGRSQFGLSYDDIVDVWKQMNRDERGGGGSAAGEGEGRASDEREEGPRNDEKA